MASMVTKLARAAFATRASPSAVGGVAGIGRPAAALSGSPAAAIGVSPADATSVSPPEGPKEEEYRCPSVDENVFKSKEAMWAFYEYWCKVHGISRDRGEITRRFELFSDTARRVYEFNNSGCNGRLAMTGLADATNEERKLRHGYRRPKK